MAGAGFCESLAHWAAMPGPLPASARSAARLALLDTMACILAGWNEPQSLAARRAFASGSVTATALALGTAAHALDLDDYELPGSTHPSAPILGALLALAGDDQPSWGRLLDAYVTGYEAIVRLGEAMGYDHYAAGWHATGTLGTIGAAAGAARLLGTGSDGIANAVALAASMGAGLKRQFGTDAKALHAGLAARAGVEAARLGAAGAQANLGVFEGSDGFRAVYHGSESRDAAAVNGRIGQPLGIEEHPILRKPWPCCAYTHRAIAAALKLRPALSDDTLSGCSVRVHIPEPFFRVSYFLRPMTPNEARFSVTYCVAAALLDGRVGPETFRPEAVTRTGIGQLLERIAVDAYDPGPQLSDMSPDHPDTVRITLREGQDVSETVAHVPGGATAPLTPAQVRQKFIDCGGGAADADVILGIDDSAPFRFRIGPDGPAIG